MFMAAVFIIAKIGNSPIVCLPVSDGVCKIMAPPCHGIFLSAKKDISYQSSHEKTRKKRKCILQVKDTNLKKLHTVGFQYITF